ncbi:altronate hydrolase [Aliiruegeria haliotis]|uniref:Altronate hydrolase n=1 Tax=Aliiruegeria haliotis TaxID=1280846 RepID=A0A2T0RMR7_9RHOB|nr:UxaA family hydrolase [Aliiruegeria haliotis]PRY22479.1 altronate hydrolase [Aliiruegeria haliotis]
MTGQAMQGWLRADGHKGICNTVVVAYLVECAHHVACEITCPFEGQDVHVIGFPGCFPNDYAQGMMEALCTHQTVGAVLLVSLGCENFQKRRLLEAIETSGRPAHLISIQDAGGTRASVTAGRNWVTDPIRQIANVPKAEMTPADPVIGTICGGSEATSGIAGNPAAGRAFDRLVAEGATCIFEETGELIGFEHVKAEGAVSPELGDALVETVQKAVRYYDTMGDGSFSQGNAEGGLSTIEEKSLGAYAKSGASPISGIVKPGERPPTAGLYLMDVVPDGTPRFGFPNINDTAEIVELIAWGAHAVIFATGRGSAVGSAISPVLKVCANPETFARMGEDMDVNAGRVVRDAAGLDEVDAEIRDKLVALAHGSRTASEDLGHHEFALTSKVFEPLGPACLQVAG